MSSRSCPAVDDGLVCGRPVIAKGLCDTHYRRLKNTGTTEKRKPAMNYMAVHQRLRLELGPASEHTCPCGNVAREWSYDHGCADELTDKDGPYCPHTEHYTARCKPCHDRHDGYSRVRRGEAHHSASLTETQVHEIRHRHAQGNITHQQLADEYAVSRATITDIISRKIWSHLT